MNAKTVILCVIALISRVSAVNYSQRKTKEKVRSHRTNIKGKERKAPKSTQPACRITGNLHDPIIFL